MRITQRISVFVTGVVICVLMASVGIVPAGSLDSPGAPGAVSSYTLEDIYSRLSSGTAGTPGTFTEPTSGPTAGTMHTLNDIMEKSPVVDVSGASAGDVLAGKTFWGLASGGWGPRTGTLATQTLTATNDTVAAGYYVATTLHGVDPNLATANIKANTKVFGILGSPTVVDTVSGTAAAGDMLSGKTAYVNGAAVTGSIATQTLTATNDTVAAGYYAATTLHVVDTNLVTGNIKSGASIFGVTGKHEVVDTAGATAVSGDILASKTAYVSGSMVTGSVAAGVNFNGADGSKTITIPDGMYSGSKTATAVDTNLVAGNIKSGVSIFGVAGTLQSVTDRYLDLGDGTVRDQETGLMWTKNANLGGLMTWADAVAYCNNMNVDPGTYGYKDWRLPSVKQQDGPGGPMGKPELDTLGRPGGIPGATSYSMPGAPFTGTQWDYYWSSTTDAGNTVLAWIVRLPNGYMTRDTKVDTNYVWPVRGGQ